MENINGVSAKDYTQILGVLVEDPKAGQQAVAQEAERTELSLDDPEADTAEEQTGTEEATDQTPEVTVAVGITGAQRLQTVLTVLQALSTNSISGQIDSVDVTNLNGVELWYDERFQINLGSTAQLEYKISALRATIDKMEAYESGHLDLSFTNWPDKVGYTPFT